MMFSWYSNTFNAFRTKTNTFLSIKYNSTGIGNKCKDLSSTKYCGYTQATQGRNNRDLAYVQCCFNVMYPFHSMLFQTFQQADNILILF